MESPPSVVNAGGAATASATSSALPGRASNDDVVVDGRRGGVVPRTRPRHRRCRRDGRRRASSWPPRSPVVALVERVVVADIVASVTRKSLLSPTSTFLGIAVGKVVDGAGAASLPRIRGRSDAFAPGQVGRVARSERRGGSGSTETVGVGRTAALRPSAVRRGACGRRHVHDCGTLRHHRHLPTGAATPSLMFLECGSATLRSSRTSHGPLGPG